MSPIKTRIRLPRTNSVKECHRPVKIKATRILITTRNWCFWYTVDNIGVTTITATAVNVTAFHRQLKWLLDEPDAAIYFPHITHLLKGEVILTTVICKAALHQYESPHILLRAHYTASEHSSVLMYPNLKPFVDSYSLFSPTKITTKSLL